MKADGKPASYPAIQLELSRVYTTEEGVDSAPQVVNTLVWDSRRGAADLEGGFGQRKNNAGASVRL